MDDIDIPKIMKAIDEYSLEQYAEGFKTGHVQGGVEESARTVWYY